MIDYVKKKYDELLASVLDPLFKRVLGLSLFKRIALLLLLPFGWTAWETRVQINEHLLTLNEARKVLLAPAGALPIDRDDAQRLARLADRLRNSSANDAGLVAASDLTGWSAAQSALATAGDPAHVSARAALLGYMRQRKVAACACWSELNSEGADKGWLFISGWALAALAMQGQSAEMPELEHLFAHQQVTGAWLPTSDAEPEFASVYTTAWALIGLRSQLDAGLLTAEAAQRAHAAVAKGSAWLMNTRLPGARWKPYPLHTSSNISPTVSAVAMHALKRVAATGFVDMQREWLDGLPATPIPSSIGENLYVEIRSRAGIKNIDHFVQITLPWMLVATVDAFDGGSVMQRAKALRWFDMQINKSGLMNADAEAKQWWRAEMSMGVNHLTTALRARPEAQPPAGAPSEPIKTGIVKR